MKDLDLQPITLPVLAWRLILDTAWSEGVNAGALHGRAAHHQRDERVEQLLISAVAEAEDWARRGNA